MTTTTYEVLEDNAGGLHLYVYEGDRVVYSHSGYEYNPGQLSDDLRGLAAGSDVAEWDGGDENPQAERDDWDRHEHGSKVIADETQTYPDRMGSSGMLEFGARE